MVIVSAIDLLVYKLQMLYADKLSILFAAYLLMELIGLLYTDIANINAGMVLVEMHILFIVVPFIFYNYPFTNKIKNHALVVYIATCAIASIICIIGNIYISMRDYDTTFSEWRFSHNRFSEPIGMQAVYFAMYLSMSIIILFNKMIGYFNVWSKARRLMLVLLLLFFFVVLVTLGARTITVALVFILFLTVCKIALEKKSYTILFFAILVPLIFIALIFTNPVVTTRFMDLRHNQVEGSNYESYFARTNIWTPGLDAIKGNILFGVGTGDQQAELNKQFIKHDYLFGVNLFNMHNQYLQIFLGYGILGLLLFIFILYTIIKTGIQKKNFILLSFVLLFMMTCLTESVLCRNKGVVFFVFFTFFLCKSNHDNLKVNHG